MFWRQPERNPARPRKTDCLSPCSGLGRDRTRRQPRPISSASSNTSSTLGLLLSDAFLGWIHLQVVVSCTPLCLLPVAVLASRTAEGLGKATESQEGWEDRLGASSLSPARPLQRRLARGCSGLPAPFRKRVGTGLMIINTWGAFCLRSALQTRPN